MKGLDFSLTTDPEDAELCREIVADMVRLFQVSEAEAIGRMNDAWRGVDFEPDDLRHHETAEYWANTIYYGKGSAWWTNPPNLTPLPYAGPR